MCSEWLKAKVSRRHKISRKTNAEVNCPEDLNDEKCSMWLKENIKNTDWSPSDFCPDDLTESQCSEWLKAKVSRKTNMQRNCPSNFNDQECADYMKENVKESKYSPSDFCPSDFS